MAYYHPPELKFDILDPGGIGNLAEKLEPDQRRALADFLIDLIKIDEGTMSDWLAKTRKYLANLEGGRVSGTANGEQRGSDEETAPPSTDLTLSAVVQFAAHAVAALLGEPDLAKASETGAEGLAEWVSQQLRTADTAWTSETDPLVIHMAVTGLAWRKRTFDDDAKAFHSYFLTSSEVIVNANGRSVDRMPRITHQFERYPYEIQRSIQRGHWVDYEPRFDDEKDPQAPKAFYETDLWIDLDGDGIDEPWTITIARDDMPQVVKIKPRWSKKTVVSSEDELFFKPARRFYPYVMLPDFNGGFLPHGFGWLLDRAEGSADRLLAAICDTVQNSAENGGLFGGTSSLTSQQVELKNNRMNFVPTDGMPLAQAVQMFPTKEVSGASVQVLEKMITLGDRIAGTLNLLENAPASMTATLAKGLIDTGTQVQSAIHRRMVQSMTNEMRAFVVMADAYDQLPPGQSAAQVGGVAVTADPQLATEMHRSALAGVYMELMQDPLTDPFEVRMRLFQLLRLPQPEKLLGKPPQQQATPKEQGDIAVKLHEAQTKRMNVIAQVILALAQARKTLVEAQAGNVDIRMSLLQMAQLENAVQGLLTDGSQPGSGGMAPAPGDANAPAALPPPQGGPDDAILGGHPGGPGDAGAGVGLPQFGGAVDGAAGEGAGGV